MSITEELGQSERIALYEIADDELAIGSTLGGPKAACIIKATGAIQLVYSSDIGQVLFGTMTLRHYDGATGMHLVADRTGTFVIHPAHQEHRFALSNGVRVSDTVFVLSGEAEGGERADPPAVYRAVEMRNDSADAVEIKTLAFADLRGQTGHDVVAEYDTGLHTLIAWNASQPDWVRLFGCSEKPEGVETTLDYGKAVSDVLPGGLSGRTDAPTDPLGVFQHTHTLAPGETCRFHYLMSFGLGKKEARHNYRLCPTAAEALARTTAHYHEVLGRSIVLTPNPQVNQGVLWAKANMLRVMAKSPTGWCFVNDPTRSNNSVGRDTAWFAYGGAYIAPEFVRQSLLAYVHNQESNGKVVEYYDIRTGVTADYKLNINDDTPLLILALWHHYNTTGDRGFLEEVYAAAVKAAQCILAERNDQGLVWCTATGTSDWGIVGWRNVIENYRLSGATTEVNSECYAALKTVSHMARVLGKHEDSANYMGEAEALRTAINTHLKNPQNGLYYLNIDVDGYPRSDVTSDLVFPVMFGVADEDTSARIVSRLSDKDFWTVAGMRTTPRDAPNYSPKAGWGLLGGVWVGCSFWYAFAAARYNSEFMDHALSASFRNFSMDPRRNNTVPGQFSEWLHGETGTNEGMMLSPWDPPRYLWAAVEGAAGLEPSDDAVSLHPRLAPDWKWLGVRNLLYRGRRLTWFVVRAPELQLYTNFHPQQSDPYQAYDEDITLNVRAGLDSICVVGLRRQDSLLVLVGNTAGETVNTSIRLDLPLTGSYRVRVYESLLGRWDDHGVIPAATLQRGRVLQIERRGFSLLEVRQES